MDEAIAVEAERPPIRYATFTGRFRALAIDNAVMLGCLSLIAVVSEVVRDVPGSGRLVWAAFFFGVFLYEPLLVAYRGATIGHRLNHLTVVCNDTGLKPGFPRALARFIVKIPLGALSFLAIAVTRRYQALHDLATSTTVQVATDDDSVDFHLEVSPSDVSMPSGFRRAAVGIAYMAVTLILAGMAVAFVGPAECSEGVACTPEEDPVASFFANLWLIVCLGIAIAAWRGALFGARATRLATPTSGQL